MISSTSTRAARSLVGRHFQASFSRPSTSSSPSVLPTRAFSINRPLPPSQDQRPLSIRNIHSSPVVEIHPSSVVEVPVDNPSHASISDDIVHDYPDVHEREKGDWGHSTIGGPESRPVGRHTRRTLGSFSMQKKVCVVTGAARGLGNLFARTFAESGSNAVAILDLKQSEAEEAAKELEKWFIDHGEAEPGEIKAIGIGCDVSSEDAVKEAFARIKNEFGTIDTLVTAAGIVHNYPATEYPTDRYKQLWSINVDGTFFCAREAAKIMIEQEKPGSIVFIGSMSGSIVNIPQPQSPYNASKAAIRHMASSLGVEWATKQIRVNCISPGYMLTSLTRTILDRDPALREHWEHLTPMGRVGEPEDLKGAVIYLASDASAFTTGTDLIVDGGYTLT